MNLNIYKIRVEQKSRQVEQFRKKTHQMFDEVRELKEKLRDVKHKELRVKVGWRSNQATGSGNEDIVDYYKQISKQKEHQVKNLNKRLRSYTLQQKRITLVERAYELEREDTMKRVINLQNQVTQAKLKGYDAV